MIGVDIRNEYSNIAEYDKAAKNKIKDYCRSNGNKLDSKMQNDLIELLKDTNIRGFKLTRLLKELNIKFSYSFIRDQAGFKYIIVRI